MPVAMYVALANGDLKGMDNTVCFTLKQNKLGQVSVSRGKLRQGEARQDWLGLLRLGWLRFCRAGFGTAGVARKGELSCG